jgi:hypothetical protein
MKTRPNKNQNFALKEFVTFIYAATRGSAVSPPPWEIGMFRQVRELSGA